MSSTAASTTVDAAIPVGNVSSALSRNETTKPTKQKPGDKAKNDPRQVSFVLLLIISCRYQLYSLYIRVNADQIIF